MSKNTSFTKNSTDVFIIFAKRSDQPVVGYMNVLTKVPID